MAGKRKNRDDSNVDPLAERTAEISNEIQALTHGDLVNRLQSLADDWRTESPPDTFGEIVDLVFKNIGIDLGGDIDHGDEGSYGLRHAVSVLEMKEIEAVTLFSRLKEAGALEDGTHIGKVRRLLESIFYAKKIALSVIQSKIAYHDTYTLDKNLDERLGSYSIRYRWFEDVKTTDTQKLIVYLLDVCMERHYRKYDGHVFEPIVSEGHRTYAYHRVASIKDFVHNECRKELNLDAFLQLTKTNMPTLVDHMTHCKDIQFPFLEKNRGVFSFRNGLYLCEEDQFVTYDLASTYVPECTVSCNFFDIDFDPTVCDRPWRDIRTPNSEKIFYDQKLTMDVREWVYILIGRILYTVGKHDGWQVIPMLLGVAGSGKSTIVDGLVGSIYDRVDVGVLSNNCEKQWAVSGLMNKLIWICPEIKADFALEQATFQSMVSGERLSVAEKHKTPYSTKFSIPGFLAGNVLPSWTDHSGSVARRMLIIRFDEKIKEHDMLLGDRIRQELPRFIVKANKAYREIAREHGTKNIWTVLPDDLIQFSKDAMTQNDLVSIFIKTDRCTLGETYATTMDDFTAAFQSWGYEFGSRTSTNEAMREIVCGRDIGKYGLTFQKTSYIVNGEQRHGTLVVGIKVTETTQVESFVPIEAA